jgi:uncharacterized protein with ParB-like and HNH nuclease domain
MTKTFQAHDRLIGEIFQGSYQFKIPHYQRPYAWTTEQAAELFDDLVLAMRDASDSQYFLGSIVLIKEDEHRPETQVVDGQQRLTTLTILFAALRAAWEDAGASEGVRSVTRFLYEEGDEMLGRKANYRLIARDEDAKFFREFIQEPGSIAKLAKNTELLKDSQLHYRENASLLLQKVEELLPDERLQLWRFLVSKCSLVVISTPDLEAAYRIFSVLNNRGLDLAPIDILKADVLGLIRKTQGEEKSRKYAQKWSDTETTLGRDAFGDLFGHIRTIYAKQKQKATLVKEFREYVTEYKNDEMINLIDNVIEPYAEVWNFARNADFETTEQAEAINDTLSWLNRVDFKDWVPPALIYFKRFRQEPKKLIGFFRSLERLTYFLLVTKAGINQRIQTYANLTKEIEPESFDGNPLALKTLKLSSTDKRDFISALDGDIYRKLPSARMALMLRLDALSSDGSKKFGVDTDIVSLEHVLPQNPSPNSGWIKWFPDEEERNAWTHRLANLVPLHIRKNPAASNFDFAKKKEVYLNKNKKGGESPFLLTQWVCRQSEWTPEILAERQKELISKFAGHWELDDASTN